jgi:hypothetical protein
MTKRTRYFLAASGAVLAAGLGTGLVAYYSGGFQPVSASAVSNELRYVPADATVVAYADVRAIMNSDLRARLKDSLPAHEQGQQEFQAETGIDIEKDIDYVVASLTATGGEKPAPLVVARGRFNDTQLEGLIRDHGGAIEEYKGKRLVVCPTGSHNDGPIQNGSMTLAFLEPGLVAIGESSAVKNSIDAQLSAQSVTGNNEMMELVNDIGQGNNAWAVGRFDVLASQARLPEQVSSRLPQIKWFAAAGHVNGGLTGTLRAEARDDQAAENLRDVVRGVLGLARMQAQADPRTQALVESIQLTGTGKTVALSFTVPAEILQMIPKSAAPQLPQAEQPAK